MTRPKSRRGKRQQGWQEEEQVDDLAVAATFAQVTGFPVKQNDEQAADEQVNTAVRAIDEGSSDTSKQNDEEPNAEANDNDESESEDDSMNDDDDGGTDDDEPDDESKDDNEEAAPAKSSKDGPQAPTTQNELDPYRTPISDLEAKFQLNLTVAEQERLRLDQDTSITSSGPVQLCAVSDWRS